MRYLTVFILFPFYLFPWVHFSCFGFLSPLYYCASAGKVVSSWQSVTVKHKRRDAFHVSVKHFVFGHIQTFQETCRGEKEGGGLEQKNRPRLMSSLKITTIVPAHFHQWDVCEINVWQSILAWCECVSGMFHELEPVLQHQRRMPIYIPGVSFHYFYLQAAVSQPDRSGICSV